MPKIHDRNYKTYDLDHKVSIKLQNLTKRRTEHTLYQVLLINNKNKLRSNMQIFLLAKDAAVRYSSQSKAGNANR